MKPHNLTVKGNQSTALCSDAEVCVSHSEAISGHCQPQTSGRYFPIFDYFALPSILTQLGKFRFLECFSLSPQS